jgi:hypothetical protein
VPAQQCISPVRTPAYDSLHGEQQQQGLHGQHHSLHEEQQQHDSPAPRDSLHAAPAGFSVMYAFRADICYLVWRTCYLSSNIC